MSVSYVDFEPIARTKRRRPELWLSAPKGFILLAAFLFSASFWLALIHTATAALSGG